MIRRGSGSMTESEGGPVAEDVRRRIVGMLDAGTLRPGDRLGSEREMAESFAVSRATLRSALVPLSRAGILERRTGRAGGTFIKSVVVERNVAELSSLPNRLEQGGHSTARSRVLATALREATGIEARRLEVEPGTELVVVQRLRYADGVPLSVECAHFPAARVPDLLEQPLGGSIYELLALRYDIVPSSSIETVEVVNANPREAAWLEIPTRTPLLSMTRVAADAEGRPFEYSADLFRADRVRLIARTTVVTERETVGTDGRVELTVTA
jgi:GntR family transcriptional regulator